MTFVTNLLAKITFCVSYFGGRKCFKVLGIKIRKIEKGVISLDFYLPGELGKDFFFSEKKGGLAFCMWTQQDGFLMKHDAGHKGFLSDNFPGCLVSAQEP